MHNVPEPRRGDQRQNEAHFADGKSLDRVVGFLNHKNPSGSEEAQ